MKKQNLLGAIALTTLAVTAAGASNAQQYTLTPNATAGASVKAAATVATEAKLDATTSKGVIGLAVVPSKTAILPGGNSILTFTLTGAHTFGTNVTPGAIVAGANCAPTTTISSGGLAAGNTVSFLLSNLTKCNNTDFIQVALPVQLANQTTALGVDSSFTTELKTPIDGGTAVLNKIVQFAPAFVVTTKADAVTTAALLTKGFTTLSGDVTLGTVVVTATGHSKGIDDVTKVAVGGDVTKADYKFVGTQVTKQATLLLDAVAVPTTGLIAVATPVGKFGVVTAAAGGEAIAASTYTVATTLTLDAAYTAQATYGPSSLQSITREGSTYLIPWVASGTLAQSNGNATVVRIANLGSATTGAVSAELLTSSTAVPASTALVALSTGITKGSDLVVTGASLQTAFGADFGRGDVRITVESLPNTLMTRRFIQNVANGSVTEVSLGRSEITPATPGNVISEPVN